MVSGGCGGQRQPLAGRNSSKQQQEGGGSREVRERKEKRGCVCCYVCLARMTPKILG